MENWKRIKFVPLTADEYMMLPPNFQKKIPLLRSLAIERGGQKVANKSRNKGPIGPSPLRRNVTEKMKGGKRHMRRTYKNRK